MPSQAILQVTGLPDGALDAAAEFHAQWLGQARAMLESDTDALAVVMPSAPHAHDDWRRAAARDLARAYAPRRVNVIGADPGASLNGLIDYCANSPGVTGQYLAGHG